MKLSEDKIYITVVTPEEKVFEGEVGFISVPAQSGSLGVLPKHLPIISELGIGILKLVTEKESTYIGVCRGYFEYIYGKANVLTERAIKTTYENREEAVEELKKKYNIIQEITDETRRVVQAIATLKSL